MSQPRLAAHPTLAPRLRAHQRAAIAVVAALMVVTGTAFVGLVPAHATVPTVTWSGAGANQFWSTPGNWVGGTVPVAGDNLVFPPAAAQKSNINDLADDTQFNTIDMQSVGYAILGNYIDPTGGITGPPPGFGSSSFSAIDMEVSQSIGTGAALIFGHLFVAANQTLTIVGTGAVFAALNGNGHVVDHTPGTTLGMFNIGLFAGTIDATGSTFDTGNGAAIGAGSLTTIGPGADVTGIGTVGSLDINSGGNLSLGGQPGTMTALGSFTAAAGSTFTESLQDCLVTSYGKLAVNGAADITGATLAVNASSFGTTPGSVCTILSAPSGIAGTFAGQPDGSTITTNGVTFVVHYTGTTVTLSQITTGTWSGASATSANWSDGANWVGGTVPPNGAVLIFPAGAQQTVNTNDLTLGTSFGGITTAANYVLGGANGLILTGGLSLGDGTQLDMPLQLLADATFTTPGKATLAGTLNDQGHKITIAGPKFSEIDLSGMLSGTGSVDVVGYRFSETGGGTFSGGITVENGANFNLYGGLPSAALTDFGFVQGDHAIGATAVSGGELATIGKQITLDNGLTVTAGGTLEIDDNACNGNINVLGAVSLSSGSNLITNPGANTNLGDTCTIISNDNADPVAGTFNGQPEGSTYVYAGYSYTISYAGGDGNDVTLNVTAVPGGPPPPPPPAPVGSPPALPVPTTIVNAPKVVRISGPDRLGTAIAASQDHYPTAGSAGAVVLARSDRWADALAATPLAVVKGGPLLINPSSSALDSGVAAEISRVLPAAGTVYVIGGPRALAPSVDSGLTAAGFQVVRLAGADRFATAVAIAHQGLGDPSVQFLATGDDFPDALAGGAAAAHVHGAILLTDGPTMAPATAAYLAATPGTRYALGGPAATAMSAEGAFTPIAGADRYATAIDVAETLVPNPTVVGLATGSDFADALAGAADVGARGGPLVLTRPDALPGTVAAYLAANKSLITLAEVYGGAGAVDDAVLAQLRSALS